MKMFVRKGDSPRHFGVLFELLYEYSSTGYKDMHWRSKLQRGRNIRASLIKPFLRAKFAARLNYLF